MRPYRAIPITKPIDSGEFVFGWYASTKGKHYIVVDDGNIVVPNDSLAVFDTQLIAFFEVHPSTIGQQVGLCDKNGKEAYHKDICVGNWPYADKCIIEWDEERCGFYLQPVKGDGLLGRAAYDKGYKLNARKFEIIGNIHTAPQNGKEKR